MIVHFLSRYRMSLKGQLRHIDIANCPKLVVMIIIIADRFLTQFVQQDRSN